MSRPQLSRLRAKDFTRFNDWLHGALNDLGDILLPPWVMRCVEFHFGQGRYAVGDSFGWHLHKDLQLEVILEGSFRFSIKGKRPVTIERGEVFIVPPGSVHRWRCLEPALMIGISLAPVPQADESGKSIEECIEAGTAKPVGMLALTDSLMREFNSKVCNDKVFFQPRLRSWMHLIITQTLREIKAIKNERIADSALDSSATRSQRVVSKIIRFIDANIGGDLSMPRFEQAVGLSSRQIHRIFVEVTGMSCHNYIVNRRLEVARSMLQADSTMSVKEVAFATGFASAAHFSSSFRKLFGVKPSDYF
jgi:AraC-like DNA-binding protein/mannose-6-phosphate isomerase-like protein (cupin superfamily)